MKKTLSLDILRKYGLVPVMEGNEDNIHINKISAKRRPGCNAEAACRELSHIYDFIRHEGAFGGSTIEMIAMGDSSSELAAEADYVTASAFECGITQALKHYGLIC